MIDVKAMTSLVLESDDHAQRIEIIIKQSKASEADARANAMTPELTADLNGLADVLRAHRDRIAAIRAENEAAAPGTIAAVPPPPVL